MFIIDCPRHQSRVMLGTRSIECIDNTPDGIDVHWQCHCGARGVLHTGRLAGQLSAPAAPPSIPPSELESSLA